MTKRLRRLAGAVTGAALAMSATATWGAAAPTMLVPSLDVRTHVAGLTTPTRIAFIGSNDLLVLEKNTGLVRRVTNGQLGATVLDLGVNSASERGLLGIALHPNFPTNPGVYLYWSCSAPPPPAETPFFPTRVRCAEQPELGADTDDILAVPLLGNRVDRFVWTGSTLAFDRNLIMLRSFQHDGAPTPSGQGDETQPARGNHDGGVVEFGPDRKLYVYIGDVGRRGQLQNLACGPAPGCPGPIMPDDQFGGPAPDEAHLTGVVLRLNDDGSTPTDNPYFGAGAAIGGSAGSSVQKVFAYGIRNGFGMAFDPFSGALWEGQNGDDSFTELNLVDAGANLGWIQVMGPLERIAQFKEIETTPPFVGLQQLRWPPERIADTPAEALRRLVMLPGAHYSDPEFSWKFEVAPAGVGFVSSRALGPQFTGDLVLGAARPTLAGGHLFRFDLTGNRRNVGVDDPRLEDRVADNVAKFDLTESESLLFGREFGVATDIRTGPNGNLFVVSLDHGAVYEIFRRR